MAAPTSNPITILSYNSTGFNSVKAQWIRDLMDITGAKMLGVQEHFKNTQSIQRLFKKEFPKCDSVVVPAYREEGRDTGRAKGGLAQIRDKSLDGVKSQRVCRLTAGGCKLKSFILGTGDCFGSTCTFPQTPKF